MNVRRHAVIALVSALTFTGAALTVTAADAATGDCTKVLAKATRAGEVARSNPSAFKKAEARNAGRVKDFAKVARTDKSLWLDQCATAYFVEGTASAAEQQSAAASMASAPLPGVPLTDTFTLESKPGSSRTIYLDVKGATVNNTAWNQSYGANLVFEPYSIDAVVDTNFSDAELTEIQKMWQAVAEDYAPFDVNITLKDPGTAAIDRTSSADLVYGTRALITNGGTVYNACGCGGVAYVNVFNTSGANHMYYQPALVFSNGTTKNGKYVGEATAHEVGHNFGLNHDGTASSGYYSGSSPWAPIMGASYSQPVSQWSKGEYPGANNQQDDLAQIATGAAVRADEDASGPLALANNASVNGIITRSTDLDSYTFVAAGPTTVSVDVSAFADLDVELQILATGSQVGISNPTTTRVSATQASGMNASFSFNAPAEGATYTAQIRGAGQGDPGAAGGYSAYGSIGNYQVSLTTGDPGQGTPLGIAVGSMPNATAGTAYSASPVSASGGTQPYTFSATGLPAGLSINAATGAVTGTPSAAGSYTPNFTVTDNAGGSASQAGAITVDPAPVVTPLAWLTGSTLPTGKARTAYSTQIKITGGTPNFSWLRTSGQLPGGTSFTFSGTTATLSGKPNKAGTFTFSLRVTDSKGAVITRTFTLTITK